MSRVKTMRDWDIFAEEAAENSESGDFMHFCEPGDLVDETIFDHFLNGVPPHYFDMGYLQAGEPYENLYNPTTGRYQDTWITFVKLGKGVYRYCGHCFHGDCWDSRLAKVRTVCEFLKNTYRINHITGEQEQRPRIYCKDGFNISVQASNLHYCSPRKTLKNGKYKTVECGMPSAKEELLADYAEDPRTRKTVYPYTPVELVDKVLEKHGGIVRLEA